MARKKGLTKAQQGKMRVFLQERQNWLLSDVRGRLAGTAREDVDRGGDEGDLATMSLTSDLDLEARARESRELQLIELALSKIQEGVYGICEECGQTIAIARLQALPFAPYCIDCQERFEEEGIEAERREYQTLD